MEFLMLPNNTDVGVMDVCTCYPEDGFYPECIPLYCGRLCMANDPCNYNVCSGYVGPTPYSNKNAK